MRALKKIFAVVFASTGLVVIVSVCRRLALAVRFHWTPAAAFSDCMIPGGLAVLLFWLAWMSYREGVSPSAAPLPIPPPAAPAARPKPLRVLAVVGAVWLFVNGVALWIIAVPLVILIVPGALCAGLGWLCFSHGGALVGYAQGRVDRLDRKGNSVPLEPWGDLVKDSILCALVWWAGFVCVEKAPGLMRKANEDSTRGNLGALRSALSIYYGDMEGQYPDDPASLTLNGKYLRTIPMAKTPFHHRESSVIRIGASPTDEGGWLYNNVPVPDGLGAVTVNCTHTDAGGKSWSEY